LVSAHPILEGRVYIAIDELHVTLAKMTEKDIAVVGDNEPAQLALVSAGIAALIIVAGSMFRAACVVSAEGKLRGILTRTTLLDDVRRPVVLLDHNEASQAVPGIEEADVVEIIDHHRLGAITTLRPIRFFNDPVGATSTIIAMKYREAGLAPSREIAGILLCGILSDTLSLQMSTTTHQDKKAVKYLAKIAGEDPEKLGVTLL